MIPGPRNDRGTTARSIMDRELRRGTMKSRSTRMEREKAMDAARNPGFSKFGDCLVSINSKTDKLLTRNLNRINSEIRRMELQLNQKKKLFLRNSGVLNHDPIILVERPASPDVIRKARAMSNIDGLSDMPYENENNKPGYMKPLRSRARTPSTITTIDAFTVRSKKKRNVWEEAMDEKASPQFTSSVRPYAKLTRREVSDLQIGYSFHKPRITPDTGLGSDSEETASKVSSIPIYKKPRHAVVADDGEESDDGFTPFITQMASVRENSKNKSTERLPVVEINVRQKSPKDDIDGSNRVKTKSGRTVRFSSPVPRTKKAVATKRRKLKTKATTITY